MDETAHPKICITCGADVNQKHRHKNRNGDYYCPACYEVRKQAKSRQEAFKKALTRIRLAILVVIVVAGASWTFVKLLDMANRPGEAASASP